MVFHGLKRSFTFLSRCFTIFHAMCRPTWQFIKLLSHSYLSIGNLIPSVHWLPRQEERVHYSHDRFHTLHVHVMWLIQTGWDETSRFLIVLFISIMPLTPNSRGTFVNFMTNSSLKATMPPDLVQMGWASVDPGWSMHIHVYPVTLNRRRCTLIVFCRGLFLK